MVICPYCYAVVHTVLADVTLTAVLQAICCSVSTAWLGSVRRCFIFSVNFLVLAKVLHARDAHTSPMVIKCYLLFSSKHKSQVGRDIS